MLATASAGKEHIMKFQNKQHAQQFLIEIQRMDLVETATVAFVPDEAMIELFLKSRESIIPKLKSFRKAQASKAAWRKNRYKYMKGIKAFHKSTEGKRFHRSLGRFLATRMHSGDKGKLTMGYGERFESLKGISSLRTHLYIDTMYYRPLDEQVDFDLYLDEAVIATINEEKRLYEGDGTFVEADNDILLRSVDPSDLLQEYCTLIGAEYKPAYLEKFQELVMLEDFNFMEVLKKSVPDAEDTPA